MAAVLTSSVGGLSDEELAELRLSDRSAHLYKNMQDYLAQGGEHRFNGKAGRIFLSCMTSFAGRKSIGRLKSLFMKFME